jgi:REP element-mobilizing transposase RayT
VHACTLFAMRYERPFSPEPIAYFLTWTTYGSWLPGDGRGWSDKRGGMREPNLRLKTLVASRLSQRPVTLTIRERMLVTDTIARHCRHRGWELLAVACRSQHVHVVVATPGCSPTVVSQQLKARSTRALAGVTRPDKTIWTRNCSRRRIYCEADRDALIMYVAECQERSESQA